MYQRAIAVHALRGFSGWEKDVALNAFDQCSGLHLPESRGLIQPIWYQKTKAVPMNREPAGDVFPIAARGDVMPRAQLYEQAFTGQPVERVFKRVAFPARQAQLAYKLFVSRSCMRQFANVFEQAPVADRLGHQTQL
ncbi:MAG TPA: hypothetical protein VHU83_10355 [Bryobacteraceae bacterium]|nr:hypothetical protein [Bryobacteraceae bacterium]